MRQIIVYPGEDGFWVGECPSLPGCISQGASREEAVQNMREAIAVYVEALKADDHERDAPTLLGTRIAERFTSCGLEEEIPELRGKVPRQVDFES